MKKLVIIGALAATITSMADTYTWTGAASAVWNKTDNNWDKGAWVDGNVALFPASATAQGITLGEDVTVSGLQVASGDWSLGGAHTLTIAKGSGNATISQTSSASLTLKDGITVSSTANVENNINVLNIEGATFTLASGKIFHNGWNGGGGLTGGATVNIGDGGTLYAPEFIVSGSRSAADAGIYRVNVADGGVLRIGHFYKEYSITEQRYGTLCFDGGTLEGDGSQMFSYPASAISIKAGPGGMRLGGSKNIHMYNTIASDNGADGGLTVDMTGSLLYLNWEGHVGSDYTKRTFTGPVRLNRIGSVVVCDDDRNFGAVPAEPTDGIFFNTSCKLLSHGPVRLNRNRNVVIKSDVTAVIAGENGGSLAIEGTVSGSSPGATRNGTLSTDSSWVGDLSLLPPAGRTNSFGRLMVKNQGLTIGGEGTTEITDTLGNLDDLGDYGVFFVENAALNVTNGLVRVMTNNYSIVKGGAVNVQGGTLDFSRQQRYVNAFAGAATTTVARAGTLVAREYCPSRFEGEGALTRLQTGGTLVCDNLVMYDGRSDKGQMDFDGGVLAPQVASRTFFSGDRSETWFNRTPWYVREGGAVISNDVEIWTHHPFLTGAAQDGGLHKWGAGKLAVITTANTFNGPVAVHQGILVWGNANNYSTTATLVTHDGGTADINGMAQTLARVEGDGAVGNCTSLTVSGAVAPGFGASAPGRLRFNQQCVFAEGCALEVDALDTLTVAAGQDISALSLHVNDFDALDRDTAYTILDVASGGDFTGTFRSDNIPDTSAWHLRYDHVQRKVTLRFLRGTKIFIR